MTDVTFAERVIGRERAIIAGGLALIAALAWAYVLAGAGTGMSLFAMSTWRFPPPPPVVPFAAEWSPGYALTMIVMWWVMMIAMMVPAAAPVILLYARVFRHGQARGQLGSSPVPAASFAAGYLICWLGFSAAATALQFALERGDLVDGMLMWSKSRWLTAGLLFAAAVYQISPLKRRCLATCRSPASWIAHHWRPGRAGALRMGAEHGAYCIGCCWVLMLLLFAGGIMNLLWIAGLAVLVLIEKLAPFGVRLERPISVLLLGASAWVAAGG